MDKKNFQAYFNAAKLQFVNSDYLSSQKLLKSAVNNGANNPKVFNLLGDACVKLKEYNEANEYFKKALAFKEDIKLIHKIGSLNYELFIETNDREYGLLAKKMLVKLLELNRDDLITLKSLAQLLKNFRFKKFSNEYSDLFSLI